MRNLNGRVTKLEAQAAALPAPADQELLELESALLAATEAEKLEWLDGQIDQCEDEELPQFLTDWKRFLELRHLPTHGEWVQTGEYRHRGHMVETPLSREWHELHERHWQWGGWTGAGLPPELRPD